MADSHDRNVVVDDEELHNLVETRATCPFIGSALTQGLLPVRNELRNPLASIADIRELGNSGGGDLGDLLVLFARGNHAFMRGDSDNLDQPVPRGLFSLEFPGSQGSHPGHSGILQGDPALPGSGRLSRANFSRLTRLADDGWISRSRVGAFIAENLYRDPDARVFGRHTVKLLAGDLVEFVETAGSVLLRKLLRKDSEAQANHREVEEKLTKLLGEDNLVGSAGEFGLLFAFLDNRPGGRKIKGEPAVSVADLEAMFIVRRFPEGWGEWKKSRVDWVTHTTALLISASKEYRRLKKNE